MTRTEYAAHIQAKAEEFATEFDRQGRADDAAISRAIPTLFDTLPDSRMIGDADALFGSLVMLAKQQSFAAKRAAHRAAKA